MKMKKFVPVLLAACSMLAACSPNSGNKNEAISDAEKLSYAELVAKAKEEVGNNTVSVYGNSSQLEKAILAFTEETGIKVNNTNIKHNIIFS